MSIVLKFRKYDSDVTLMGGATGLQLIDEGWIPTIATPLEGVVPPPVMEMMELKCKGSSHDNLAAKMAQLHTMQVYAELYAKEQTAADPVWLHAKLDSETGERRALVYRIEATFGSSWFGTRVIDNETALSLGVSRHPWWEKTSLSSEITTTNLSTLGGSLLIPSQVGNLPARIYQLKVGTSLAGRINDHLWLGFRSTDKHGTVSNFEPLWELEDGAEGTDTAKATDSAASPGGAGDTKMVCTFNTTEAWAARVTMYLTDVTTNYADNFGRCMVLLRAKVKDGSTKADVRLKCRYRLDAGSVTEGRVVEVSGTDWKIYEMGPVTFPLRDIHALPQMSASDEKYQAIRLWARRTAGTADLDLDCLVLIPADEYFLRVTNAAIQHDRDLYVGVSPEEVHGSVTFDYASPEITSLPIVSAEGVGVPIGTGRLYGVVTRQNQIHSITDDWDPSLLLIPRWSSLRGSE